MPKNNTYLWEIQWQRHLLLLLFLCLFLPITHASAQPEDTKLYTKENPLVYEDAQNLCFSTTKVSLKALTSTWSRSC